MIDVFGMKLSKEELLERVSSMKQLGGARVFEYAEGKCFAWVKAVEVNAGGIVFTVLADRGMDIGDAYYKEYPSPGRARQSYRPDVL